jgi:hypothetical protein
MHSRKRPHKMPDLFHSYTYQPPTLASAISPTLDAFHKARFSKRSGDGRPLGGYAAFGSDIAAVMDAQLRHQGELSETGRRCRCGARNSPDYGRRTDCAAMGDYR